MKNYFLKLSLAILCIFSLFLTACKDDKDNTIAIEGKYSVVSATFNPAVTYDFNEDGTAETRTNALNILQSGLFGASPCGSNPADTQIEFTNTGEFRLACTNTSITPVKIGNWNFDPALNSILLTNIIVPDPFNPGQTVTVPVLELADVFFQQNATTGEITLNGSLPFFPYATAQNGSLLTANVDLVLKKIL